MTATEGLSSRRYGTQGPQVYLLHGGPAAVGTVRPIALRLAARFRVVEPFQRGSSPVPLTVATHITDLDRLVQTQTDQTRPLIVGHSWGAMLALAYAATHTARVCGIVLVGCGTFDNACRETMKATISQRIDDRTRLLISELPQKYPDPRDRQRAEYGLVGKAYDYDAEEPLAETRDVQPFDIKAHTETWSDMLRLQENGTYPKAFAAIDAPVLMIHGSYDPHPGRLICESLKPYLPQLEYMELDHSGCRKSQFPFGKSLLGTTAGCRIGSRIRHS